MAYVQRFGFQVSRGWATLLLIVGGTVAAAFWIGPLQPLPAELELIALDGTRVTTSIRAIARADTLHSTVRFGVPIAIRNVGAQHARPQRLALELPPHVRLLSHAGPRGGVVTPGVPLRRYTITLHGAAIPADSAIRTLPALDTLWLVTDLPSYYCTLHADQIPEFVPAPARDPALLSDVRIFYSITTRADERNTGLLAVRLDPQLLASEPTPPPPTFPVVYRNARSRPAQPESAVTPLPDLTGARFAGVRTSYCGDPEQPIELQAVMWQAAGGARMYVISLLGIERKRLYDLNGDGIIELEAWDLDGDGWYDAHREARFRTPEFLIPDWPRADALLLDVRPDSSWLALFAATRAGPFRFSRPSPAAPVPPPDTLPADTIGIDPALGDTVAEPATPPATPAARPDTARPEPIRGDTVRRDTIRPDTARGPLGTPVPPVRRDTLPR